MKHKTTTIILSAFFLFAILLMTVKVNAQLGEYDQNSCVNLLASFDNATQINISSITTPSPDSATTYINVPMQQNGQTWNYTYCSTGKTGMYIYDYYDQTQRLRSNSFIINKNHRGLLGIDLTSWISWVLMGFIFLVTIGLLVYGQWYLGCMMWMINAFLLLFNYENPIFGFILIGVGVILVFLKGVSE